LADGVRVLGVLLWPFLPERAPRILEAVGESEDAFEFELARSGAGTPGARIDTSLGPLFPRVDTPLRA
jgi:methionyl-tRNA synthetase